jgi:hypothetical protein
MAVAGSEVALAYAQKEISVFGTNLVDVFSRHSRKTPFLLLYHTYWRDVKGKIRNEKGGAFDFFTTFLRLLYEAKRAKK